MHPDMYMDDFIDFIGTVLPDHIEGQPTPKIDGRKMDLQIVRSLCKSYGIECDAVELALMHDEMGLEK